ncbi:MAG: hypothetical protein H0W76_08130 [Pyrinomonadaceae bacterium]|nr:hypothetical protein [Pyrinomonadaceae bacterium]
MPPFSSLISKRDHRINFRRPLLPPAIAGTGNAINVIEVSSAATLVPLLCVTAKVNYAEDAAPVT